MVLTVAHLIDSFDAHYGVLIQCGQAEAATREWYRDAHKKLRVAAGSFPAAELRAHHLVGVDFTNHFVRALKALYKWATDEDVDLVPKNPFRKLRTPPCGERNRVLSRSELRRLYLACRAVHEQIGPPRSRRMTWRRSPFRLFLFVMFHTLARPGEVRKLLWRDVRLDQRMIVLTKFKCKDRRRDGVKVRTIPLDLMTVRMLTNWYHRRSPRPDDPVFVSERTGKMWSPNAIRCKMRRARLTAGLGREGEGGEQVVCYTLRHTSGTVATVNGVRDRELADIMGHTTTRTTARYQHLSADHLVTRIDQATARPGRAAGRRVG